MVKGKLAALGVFALGAGIGAGVALLYAPRSGKHTRRRIRNSANRALNGLEDVREDIETRVTDWVDEASDLIATGKESAMGAFESVRSRVEDGKDRVGRYFRAAAG